MSLSAKRVFVSFVPTRRQFLFCIVGGLMLFSAHILAFGSNLNGDNSGDTSALTVNNENAVYLGKNYSKNIDLPLNNLPVATHDQTVHVQSAPDELQLESFPDENQAPGVIRVVPNYSKSGGSLLNFNPSRNGASKFVPMQGSLSPLLTSFLGILSADDDFDDDYDYAHDGVASSSRKFLGRNDSYEKYGPSPLRRKYRVRESFGVGSL